jgi:5'-3' exonuclease
MSEKQRVLFVDLGSAFWQSWHSSANDEISAAHDRAVGLVRKYRDGFDLVAVCCDSPRSLRREKHPTYKANRPDKDLSALEQLRRTEETLLADGLLLWKIDGFEADDLIAAAAKHALAGGQEVTIASSDKDLLQLVRSDVTVISLKTGVHFTPQEVMNKFGVRPDQMRDWLVLVGDASDNIEGVPRVGAKTAATLLTQFGTILGIQEALAKGEVVATSKVEESLAASTDLIAKGIELVTLLDDAPIAYEQLFEKREVKPLVDAEWDEVPGFPSLDATTRTEQTETSPATPDASPPPAAATSVPAPSDVAAVPERQTQAIVKSASAGSWALELEPTNARDAFTMATHLHNSRLYSAFGTPQAIFAVILRGRSLGLDATTALANFHVVEGKPTMHATLIVGLVLQSGKAEFFDVVETTDEHAVYVTRRKGSTKDVEMSFTVGDAVNAGVLERLRDGTLRGVSKSGKPSNWDKWRRTMLRHRCAVELARAVYPDVCAGLYTPDEISEGRIVEATLSEAAP